MAIFEAVGGWGKWCIYMCPDTGFLFAFLKWHGKCLCSTHYSSSQSAITERVYELYFPCITRIETTHHARDLICMEYQHFKTCTPLQGSLMGIVEAGDKFKWTTLWVLGSFWWDVLSWLFSMPKTALLSKLVWKLGKGKAVSNQVTAR